MTTYIGWATIGTALLAVLGYVLAFTACPEAINMALGATIVAPFYAALYVAFKLDDER